MTTPRIEQYVAEFDELLNFAESHLGVSERERLTKAFKEVEKDTLDKAVEIIKEELRNAPLEIQMTKGAIFGKVIKALQDNK